MAKKKTDVVEEVVYVESSDAFAADMQHIQHEQAFEIQQSSKRFPALVMMRSFLKVIGIILGILYFIVAFILLFTSETFGQGLLYFLLALGVAFLLLVLCFFFAEFIEVMLSIEHNTRLMIPKTKGKSKAKK